MKKHSNLFSFLLGAVTSLVLLAGVTTALAVSGQVTAFNSVNLSINLHDVLTVGDTITNSTGVEIPSSINYTDELGGGNTYLPLRYLVDTLHIPITWEQESNTIRLDVDGIAGVYSLTEFDQSKSGMQHIKFEKLDYFSVVDVEIPENGGEVLVSDTYQSEPERTESEAYTLDLVIDPTKGQYIGITVENLNDAPVEFRWGRTYGENGEAAYYLTQIPANTTITLPLKLEETDKEELSLYILVGYSDFVKPVDVSVSVVQFDIDE